jgi:hypothetical protein
MADTMDTIKDTADSSGVTVVTVEDDLTKDINLLNSFRSIVLLTF